MTKNIVKEYTLDEVFDIPNGMIDDHALYVPKGNEILLYMFHSDKYNYNRTFRFMEEAVDRMRYLVKHRGWYMK